MADPWDNDTPVAQDGQAQEGAAPWDQDTPVDHDTPVPAAATAASNADAPWENDKPAVESSLPGAVARSVGREAVPFAGGLGGMALGAGLGAVSPVPGGALIGGIVGGLGGGALMSSVQDYVLNKLGFKKGHGFFSDEQEQADEEQHPWAKDIADVGMTAASFAFNPAATVGQRLLGAGAMGGIEAGSEAVQGKGFDPSEIALRALEGGIFTDPRRATAAFMKPFEKAGQALATRAGRTYGGIGASTTPPPPDVNADIGNNVNPPERSERTYDKEKPASSDPGITQGESWMTPDVMSAIDAQNPRNLTEGPVKGNSELPGNLAGGEEPAPIKTGFEGLNGEPPAQPTEPVDKTEPRPNPIKDMVNRMSDEDLIAASKQQRELAQTPRGNGLGGDQVEGVPESKVGTPSFDTAPEMPRYKNPVLDGQSINRNVPVRGLVRLKGNELFVDRSVPRSIQLGDKTLDPAVPLGIRETSFQHALHVQEQVPGGRNMAPQQKNALAREAADVHMNDWLKKNGYDPQAFTQALTEIRGKAPLPEQAAPALQPEDGKPDLTGLKPAGEPAAEAVTATVKRPPVVDAAISELRARGTPEAVMVADAIEKNTHPDGQAMMATRAMRQLMSRGGKTSDNPQVARIPGKPAEASNGVTARTKADAERIDRSLLSADRGMEKAKPIADDFDPRDRTQVKELKEDLKGALEHARSYNRGQLPHESYKPTRARGDNVKQPPSSWLWSRAADQFVKGNISASEFAAQDKLYRSGNPEDARTGMMGNRIDADVAMNKRTGDEAVANAERQQPIPNEELVPAEEVQAKETPLATAEDIQKFENPAESEAAKGIDISKLKPADEDQMILDNSTIMQNLAKAYEPRGRALDRQLEDEARAERTGRLRRAREAAALTGRQGEAPAEPDVLDARSVPLTDAAKASALEALRKAAARGEALKKTDTGIDPLAPMRKTPPKDLVDFFKDEGGSLDFGKVNKLFKAKQGELKEALNKYFGLAVNNVQRHFDPILAGAMSLHAKLSAEKSRLLDARWYQWNKVPKENVWRYLNALETLPDKASRQDFKDELTRTGIDPKAADWMADEALMHRQLMDQIYSTDQHFVKNYDRLQGYVAHQFEDAKGVQDFLDAQRKALGATWFTKDRVFDTIRQAEAAGFKLRHQNPIDIINSRWASSINDWMIVSTLRKLNTEGLAYPVKDDPSTPTFAKKTYSHLPNTPDGVAWMIAPEGVNLWRNAMEAKSLFDRDDALGGAFRSWMKLKNVWMPLQLGLSLFHEVHVSANINPVQNIVRALRQRDVGELGKALKYSLSDPLLALPLEKVFGGKLGDVFKNYEGKQLIENWKADPATLSPVDRTWQSLVQETGARLEQNEDTISASRALAEAWQKQSYPGIAGNAIRRGIQATQDWMMKYQIPAMKAAALKRDISAAFRLDPTLGTDAAKRRIVMRQIGQNIDDRFGEMFYKSMFWNRYMKDAGIASFLSLSWNVGQVRQASGALHDAFDLAKMKTGLGEQPSGARRIQVLSNDRVHFVSGYIAMSMLAAGGMSWALSGQVPSGMDWFMPRNGEKNPDGTPGRVTVPFNTREGPMLVGHTQEAGNVLSGLAHMIYNKMIISPLVEAWQNKDFFGRELYDTHAPWYQRAGQLLDSELLNHLSPISATGASRAKELGGGARDQALAYVGFGPAPAYISHDATQNAISHDYYAERGDRPYEYGKGTGLGRGLVQNGIRALAGDKLPSEGRQEGYQKLNRAYATNDPALAQEGRQQLMREGGISAKTAGSTKPDQQFQRMFRSLSLPRQAQRFKEMSPEEQKLYVYNNPLMGPTAKAKVLREAGVKPGSLPSR